MAVTKADIATQFNTVVRNALTTPAPDAAPWYLGNVTGTPTPPVSIQNDPQLGPRPEPGKSAADIPGLAVTSASVFNVLHGFAMELTRVRRMKYILYTDNPMSPIVATNSAALNTNLALYFPIPGGQVEPGTIMTLLQLNNFLNNLRAAVQNIRTSNAHMHTVAACHSSCHGSCHGSRGRR